MSLFGGMSAEGVFARCCRIEASPPCGTFAVQLEYLRRRREGDDIRLAPSPEQAGMSPLDWQAQAQLIIRRTEIELPPRLWWALRAWYTVPEGPHLQAVRDVAVLRSARYLHRALAARGAKQKPKKVRVGTRAWVRLRGTIPTEEYPRLTKALGCASDRHVRRLLKGSDKPGEGWWLLLDSWREQAAGLAATTYWERGWID